MNVKILKITCIDHPPIRKFDVAKSSENIHSKAHISMCLNSSVQLNYAACLGIKCQTSSGVVRHHPRFLGSLTKSTSLCLRLVRPSVGLYVYKAMPSLNPSRCLV